MRKFAAILLALASFLTASAAHADYKLNPHTGKKDYYEARSTASAPQSLATGGTGASLSDPAANKLLGWDDTDNAVKFLTIGSGLSYDAGTDTLSASSAGDVTGVGDCADGACFDGSSDGGTYVRLYDGDSHYTQIASANVAGNVTITLPAVTSTVATLAGTEALTNKTIGLSNSTTSAGYADFFEDSDNGSNYARIIGPASTADVVLTLPATTGTIALTSDITGGIGGSTGATDNAVLRADGTGGATLQNSLLTVADTTGLLTTGASGQDSGLYFTDDYTSTSNGRMMWDESENTWLFLNRGVDDAASVFASTITLRATDSNRAGKIWLQGNNSSSTGVQITGGPLDFNSISAVGSAAGGFFFHQTASSVWPFQGPTTFDGSQGTYADNTVDLGSGSFRFKSGFFSADMVIGSDLGGKLNVDGSADERQLWIQGHSTQTNDIVLIETSAGADLVNISNSGNVAVAGTVTSSAAGSLGWSVVAGANTACTTTCTSAAVMGFDTASGCAPVGPADATADVCLCAGSS